MRKKLEGVKKICDDYRNDDLYIPYNDRDLQQVKHLADQAQRENGARWEAMIDNDR